MMDDLEPSATRLREARVLEMKALCDASVKEAFKENKVELINYGKLREIIR